MGKGRRKEEERSKKGGQKEEYGERKETRGKKE